MQIQFEVCGFVSRTFLGSIDFESKKRPTSNTNRNMKG